MTSKRITLSASDDFETSHSLKHDMSKTGFQITTSYEYAPKKLYSCSRAGCTYYEHKQSGGETLNIIAPMI